MFAKAGGRASRVSATASVPHLTLPIVSANGISAEYKKQFSDVVNSLSTYRLDKDRLSAKLAKLAPKHAIALSSLNVATNSTEIGNTICSIASTMSFPDLRKLSKTVGIEGTAYTRRLPLLLAIMSKSI
jgi:hypothetical protein